jgi:hypothetical protein
MSERTRPPPRATRASSPPSAGPATKAMERQAAGRANCGRERACLVPPYEQGGGYYGDIAYAWRHKDVVYHITIHGYANEPRASLMMAALIARETGP